MSDVRCPSCGSQHLRPSMQLAPVERLLELFGVVQLRCRDCDERFKSGILDVTSWLYAKCPRCYRMDLTTWKRERYRLTRTWKIKLSIGGKPYRCSKCRCNFVSFRKLRRLPKAGVAEAVSGTT
jgi:phage FluMu protein Com